MRTKAEIIRAAVPANCLWEDILCNTPFRYVEAAMDEYAKEVAIDFAAWVHLHYTPTATDKHNWYKTGKIENGRWSTEQLFTLYQQEKSSLNKE